MWRRHSLVQLSLYKLMPKFICAVRALILKYKHQAWNSCKAHSSQQNIDPFKRVVFILVHFSDECNSQLIVNFSILDMTIITIIFTLSTFTFVVIGTAAKVRTRYPCLSTWAAIVRASLLTTFTLEKLYYIFWSWWKSSHGNIHRLTSSGNYKVRVDLDDFPGNTCYAEYDSFEVKSEGEKFIQTNCIFDVNILATLANHQTRKQRPILLQLHHTLYCFTLDYFSTAYPCLEFLYYGPEVSSGRLQLYPSQRSWIASSLLWGAVCKKIT